MLSLHKSTAKTIFKYIDRGKRRTMVLIPGWATDYRIFNSLDLEFNYIVPLEFSLPTFETDLINALRGKGIDKVILFGWSLGGFLAAEFAAKYKSLVAELILVSVRKKYKAKEIDTIKGLLRRNKKGYLYKFYTQCFSQNDSLSWFKKNLLKSYCEQFDLKYLVKTLDYLGRAQLNPKILASLDKIKIIHGEFDQIAPIKEASEIKDNLSKAEFIVIKGSGHIPFIEEDLSKYIW